MSDDELKDALNRLTHEEKKLASLKWSFLRGVFYGFGVFVGSALLVALLLYLLSLFDTAPIIGEYIQRVRDIIQNR